MGNKRTISDEPFPEYDEKYLEERYFYYPNAFNGKRRFNKKFSLDLKEKQIEQQILSEQQTQKYLNNKSVKKVIIIKNKIINIVF